MHKILATAFIIALTTCYPVHAEILVGKETDRIWADGEVIASSPMETESSSQSGVYAVIKMEDGAIYHCYSFLLLKLEIETFFSSRCQSLY